jgi:hypothetical protein
MPSLVDDLKEFLKQKKVDTSTFISQVLKEKELSDAFRKSLLDTTDLIGRARQLPEGVLSKITKVDLVDLITEISSVKVIDTLSLLNEIMKVDLIDNITSLGTLNLLNTVNLIKSISSVDSITSIGEIVKINDPVLQSPNISAVKKEVYLNVPAGEELLDTKINGSGKVIIIYFQASSAAALTWLKPRLYCDGNMILPFDAYFDGWYSAIKNSTNGIYFSNYDTPSLKYYLAVALPYPFKTSLQFGFFNGDTSDHISVVSACYETLS